MPAPVAMSPQQKQQQQAVLNQQARAALLQNGLRRFQPVVSETVYPASQPQITLQPRTVGFLTKLVLVVTGTIANTGAAVASLTDIGLANLFSNIQFYDINNQQRINTNSFHLAYIAEARKHRPYGVFDGNQTQGSNHSRMFNVAPASWPVFVAPPTIAAGANGTFRAQFEIPIAFSKDNLQGGIFANVTQAQMQLLLTPSTSVIAAAGADATQSVYSGSTGTISQMNITLYQEYIDQIPTDASGAYVLPYGDMAKMYELKMTTFTGMTVSNDFPVSYPNGRKFLSTLAVYDNGNAAAPRLFGGDVNYWAIETANTSLITKIDPITQAKKQSEITLTDSPAGVYYFDHKDKPIETLVYGNTQLILNASQVNANAILTVYWEDFNRLSATASNSSLPAS